MSRTHVKNWDDFRFFLAVGRSGSFNGAARQLGISQPTVQRRVAAFEGALGFSLFKRRQDGLVLTSAGQALWDRIVMVEEAALAVERQVAAGTKLVTPIRLSATEGLGGIWLTPRLAALALEHPQLSVEIILDTDPADLSRREADLAIRLARPLTETLVARKIGEIAYQLFASKGYIEKYGMPTRLEDLSAHRLATQTLRRASPDETWQSLLDNGRMVSYKSNSPVAQMAAVRAGFGIGLLPLYMTQNAPDLLPLLTADLWRRREVWLITHADSKKNSQIRLVFDEIVKLFKVHADQLSGRREPDYLV